MLDTTTAEDALRERMEADAKRMHPNWTIPKAAKEPELSPVARLVLERLPDVPIRSADLAREMHLRPQVVGSTLRGLADRGLAKRAGTLQTSGGECHLWVSAGGDDA